MASCLQLPMTSAYSIASSTTSLTSSNNGVSSIKSRLVINCGSSNLPQSFQDSFIQRPEKRLHLPQGSDMARLMDLVNPTFMATRRPRSFSRPDMRARVRRSPWSRKKLPDLETKLFADRVLFIGSPLTPAVSEELLQQLWMLDHDAPEDPIYLFIDSNGVIEDNCETVASESEGFALYDAMMRMKCEKYTLALGAAVGQACLLLAAGTKGKRYMMPSATAAFYLSKTPPTEPMKASDMAFHAEEVAQNMATLVKLFTMHTGKSEEEVADALEYSLLMDAPEAIDFGIADKIVSKGEPLLHFEEIEDKGGDYFF